MGVEHFEGDDCEVYHPEHELKVVGYRETVIADDVVDGDFVRDPAWGDRREWYEVIAAGVDGEDVHLWLERATDEQVAEARRQACEGHETTRGAIGDTYYCDGSCV